MNWFPIMIAGGIGWAGALAISRHATDLNLIESPNHRSSHAHPTPSGGGIAIVVAGTLLGSWLMGFDEAKAWAVLMLGLILAAIGLQDDIKPVSAKIRFSVHMFVNGILLLAFISSSVLPLMNPGWLELAGVVLLFLCGVWWLNLFNFMDGIDGLASMQAIFMLGGGAILAWGVQPQVMDSPVWNWMLVLAAAAAGFLAMNWPPARIFLGDVGSTYLGFMIFALGLMTIALGWLTHAAWLILGALFAVDATVTLLRRMFTGQRWFEAHCSHAYQILARRWQSHAKVTYMALVINFLWLLPLAWCSLQWQQLAWVFILIAYLPLILLVVGSGAGMPAPSEIYDPYKPES
jgi:Fuc2NAc and GlcNAc transferase